MNNRNNVKLPNIYDNNYGSSKKETGRHLDSVTSKETSAPDDYKGKKQKFNPLRLGASLNGDLPVQMETP